MKLSDFIRANIEPIIEGWEAFARSIPSAQHLDIEALRDHAIGILQAIADDLDRAQTPDEQAKKSKGHSLLAEPVSEAGLHGSARGLSGFRVVEEVSEFRALRANVLRLWTESNPRAPETASDDLIRFNEAIDQALAESVAHYSANNERNNRLFDTLLSSSPDLNYIFDPEGRFVYANKALADLYGLSPQEIVGKNFFELGAEFAAELRERVQQVIATRMTGRGEMSFSRASGLVATYEYLLVPVQDGSGQVEAITGTARDITERKASEEEIRRRANYDFLTGLPNRSLFRDRLEWEIKRSERTGQPIALLFIDLDGFKAVNDSLGHEAGDQLLRQAAQRISACVRGTDTVARLGGDEFTVILAEVNRVAHVEILAREILEELARTFFVMGEHVHISASIGITLFPQDAVTAESLIKNADQAMYVAKNSGRNRFGFFTLALRTAAWAHLQVIDELRQALPRQQLDVYYQPIIDLSRGQVVKAEALLRWHHPNAGLMAPGEFIGLAEEAGLIGDIDQWVLDEAVIRARNWSQRLGAPFQISVNQSLVEFISRVPTDSRDRYLSALESAAGSISVEIREEVLLNDSLTVIERLKKIQNAGGKLSIDDFGKGYWSMARLKKYDVDSIKIDPSFVRTLSSDRDSQLIAETIILMAHKLGLKVVAKGVETVEQKDWLIRAACDYGQGYYFSAPLPAPEFELLLKRA
ncbi:MAG TPA: EAL domain-containing protein [Pseudomonas sp.]|nr:EAL domain-containing protein [Pseudomonas sp.]